MPASAGACEISHLIIVLASKTLPCHMSPMYFLQLILFASDHPQAERVTELEVKLAAAEESALMRRAESSASAAAVAATSALGAMQEQIHKSQVC